MQESRIQKSMINAKVNLIFYFVTLCISFFSRKIFLDYLGTDFLGLTGTIGNLMGFLNLAELGIGASIGFVLYKPIFDQNKQKICEIISVFGYLYRIIGYIILIAGVILSLFIPIIFHGEKIHLSTIYFIFYGFLISILFGYFVNYKYTLLGADQKSYIITIYFQLGNTFKTIIQMVSAYYTGSYVIWMIIELIFGILYCIILNYKIEKEYPWLKTSFSEGRKLYKQYPIIIKKSKQMFVHKISTVARYQILPFLIYPFSTLSTVAYYGNYTLVTAKLGGLITSIFNSTGAGVGNLIAENNTNKIMDIYWELNAIRYFFTGIIIFGLYSLISPFFTLWLGKQYVLSQLILVIILIDVFINQIRGTNDQFINGYGLFQDIGAPIIEITLVVSCSIIGGWLYGFPGVLLGSLPSDIIIISFWKPYFLFSRGFKISIKHYWINISKITGVMIINILLCIYLISFIPINPYSDFIHWTIYSIIILFIFIIIYGLSLYVMFSGFKFFVKRIIKKYSK